MVTALDAPFDALAPDEQTFIAKIKEHGWFNTSVIADDEGPGFSYTTGLWTSTKSPEIIMFGMKREIVHDIFWDVFRDAQAGVYLPLGARTDQVFANLPAYAFPVAEKHYATYLGWSRWFYVGDDFPCLQIIWPDRAGVFPWEAGFDATFAKDQPDLTENGWLAALA